MKPVMIAAVAGLLLSGVVQAFRPAVPADLKVRTTTEPALGVNVVHLDAADFERLVDERKAKPASASGAQSR